MTLYKYLQKAELLGSLTEEDVLELQIVLQNKSVAKMMAVMATECSMTLENASGWNLTTPQGIAEAATQQGRVRGIQRALDIIWSTAQMGD